MAELDAIRSCPVDGFEDNGISFVLEKVLDLLKVDPDA